MADWTKYFEDLEESSLRVEIHSPGSETVLTIEQDAGSSTITLSWNRTLAVASSASLLSWTSTLNSVSGNLIAREFEGSALFRRPIEETGYGVEGLRTFMIHSTKRDVLVVSDCAPRVVLGDTRNV